MLAESDSCRHEFVKIYQRKLKGLVRRLVATRAYLPLGFKVGDFNHLGDGSYSFCTRCRKRLHPKRTQAEKEAARLALQATRQPAAAPDADDLGDAEETGGVPEGQEAAGPEGVEMLIEEGDAEIHVEELEVEAPDMQDLKEEGVDLDEHDADCQIEEDE